MGILLQFPYQQQQQQQVFEVDQCAGCKGDIPGDYWEVKIPLADGGKKVIALCDACNEDVLNHGVVL